MLKKHLFQLLKQLIIFILKKTDDHTFKIINQTRYPIKFFENFNISKFFEVVLNKFRIIFFNLKKNCNLFKLFFGY